MPLYAAEETPTSRSALAVSPAIIENVLDPGKPTPFTLQLANGTSYPLPIKATVRDFTVQSTELEKVDRARLDASQWFTIDEPDFILQPNQTRTITGHILAPLGAVPGGHYATVFFQPLIPQEALSQATAYLSTRVGVLSFLIVKGDIKQQAEYGTPLSTPGVLRHGPVPLTFSIHNTGNVHLIPTGKIVVYDWRGHQVGKIDLPTRVVLPDSTKKFTQDWNPPSAFGKYRAELQISYGSDELKLPMSSVTFWVMPWLELLIGFGGILAISFFISKTKRRWRKAWRALRGKDIYRHR